MSKNGGEMQKKSGQELAARLLSSVFSGKLETYEARFSHGHCLTVVLAAEGYPGPPVKGTPIGLPETPGASLQIFHAGTAEYDGQLVTNGGRVLGITAWANGLTAAREQAYDCLEQIRFPGMHFRQDIGLKALG